MSKISLPQIQKDNESNEFNEIFKPKSPEGPPPLLLSNVKPVLYDGPKIYREKFNLSEGPLMTIIKKSKSYDGPQLKKFYQLDKYKSKTFNSSLYTIYDLENYLNGN